MSEANYFLGVDIGTTFTAAAIHRVGRTEIATLGNVAPPMPSLVFLREDGELLVGEAAERRGLSDPHRLAREFKRRVGDDTPIMLGGSPYSAERLISAVVRDVVATITAREGSPPTAIALSHPANWGPFKTDVLRQACDLAGLRDVTLVSEPVAAAVHYSSTERLDAGAVVAVYDLGGGTFDAAVLRKTAGGFATLGEPEGIERLGGIDFDAAVLAHVRQSLGGLVDELDVDDPAVRTAVARLRHDCVAAKEALSFDTEATVPVLLPNVQTQLRLTRPEFETMIRPPLLQTIEVLRRTLTSAGVVPGELAAVLLVGGSSRIPLVAEMVAAELGRPVAVDVHPKHAVALGAALLAAGEAADSSPGLAATAAMSAPTGAATVPTTAVTEPLPLEPEPRPPADAPLASAAEQSRKRRRLIPVVVAAVVVLLGIGATAFALSGGGDDSSEDASSTDTTVASPCGSESGRCASITGITVEDGTYVVRYEVANFDPVMFVEGQQGSAEDHHVHFFFNSVPPERAGTNGNPPGEWIVWDRTLGHGELVFNGYKVDDRGDATQMCIEVADSVHGIETNTGNCVDLPVAPEPAPATARPRSTSPSVGSTTTTHGHTTTTTGNGTVTTSQRSQTTTTTG